jgi:type I restriction enzyme R subunit
MSASSPYIDFKEKIQRHKNHLPHWQQDGVLQFVTWHLGDALPVSARRKIKFERSQWLNSHPQPWDTQTEKEYFMKFDGRIQNWLDQGMGKCWLRDSVLSEVVAKSFHFQDTKSYNLDSFVIMPNHVHVLFQPTNNVSLERIIRDIKGFTSHEINKQLNRKGTFWMEDYWDRMIRGEMHYLRVRKYMKENPTKAKLAKGDYKLWMSEGKLWG